MVSKSRLPDAASLPPDPILDGIGIHGRDRPMVPTSFLRANVDRDQVKSLQERIDAFEAQKKAGGFLMWLDPKLIGHSSSANRHPLSLSMDDPKFAHLYTSISKNGQDEAISIRPASEGSAFKFEIVKGHRRHAVCLLLDSERSGGFQIKCLLNEKARDAKELFLHMFRENHDRADLSPWEQGEMFKKALDSHQFSDSVSLAEACHISPSTVSLYVSIAELPAEVILAFSRPQSIAMRWSQSLNRALKASRSAVIECARHIATLDPPLQPQDVLKKLVEAAESDSRSPPREDVVKLDNKVLFRYKSGREGPVIRYGKLVRPEVRKLLDDKIKALLESEIRERWDR